MISVRNELRLIPAMSWDSLDLYIVGSFPASCTLFTAGVQLKSLYVTSTVVVGLGDDFSCRGEINFLGGTFNSNGHKIICERMLFSGPLSGVVNLFNSEVYTDNFNYPWIGTGSQPIILNADSTTFIVTSTNNPGRFNCAGYIGHFRAIILQGDSANLNALTVYLDKLVLNKNHKIIAGKVITDSLLLYNAGFTGEFLSDIEINQGMVTNSTPSAYVSLQAVYPIYITKKTGDVCIDYAILQNINTNGTALFYAGTGSTDLGGNNGWIFAACGNAPPGYYWVGNSGKWSDLSHWATSSGGTTFHNTPPDSTDDIYFDQNSFSSAGEVVLIDITATTKSILASQSSPFALVFNGGSVKCHGSIKLNSSVVWDSLLQLELLSPYQVMIDAQGVRLGGSVFITGPAYLMSDLVVYDSLFLWQHDSTFNFFHSNGNDIKCLSLYQSKGVDLNFSTITAETATIEGSSDYYQTNLTNANYVILPDRYSFSHIWFNNVSHIASITIADGYLYSDSLSLSKLIVKGKLNMLSGLVTDLFYLNNPGDTVVMSAGDTVYFNRMISYSPNAAKIVLTTSGGTAMLSNSGSSVCLHDIALQAIVGTGGAQFFADTSCTDLGGNFGWQFIPCSIISDVWPGDANYDGIVSNDDVLNIGLAYNNSGPVRPAASVSYVAQPASDWNNYFITGTNYKHADTNGDGVVDATDTTAISLNYGLSHPLRLNSSSGSGTDLYILVNDSASMGDTLQIDFYLGTPLNPAVDIYGLAFTLNFNDSIVDSPYAAFDYSNSWLGTPGIDLLTFEKPFLSSGKIDFALTRTDQNNVSGSGLIGSCGIVIVDNIGAKLTVPFSITDAVAISANELPVTLNIINDTLELDTVAVGVKEQGLAHVVLYPNPSYGTFRLHSSELVNSIEITDLTGNIITSVNVNAMNPQIKLELNPGLYIVKVLTEKGSISKKLSITSKL